MCNQPLGMITENKLGISELMIREKFMMIIDE